MNKKNKSRFKNIFLYGGLGLLIAFVVITSIVLNYKNKQLENLNNKNSQMEEVLGDENAQIKLEKDENFSKNLINFIDID